MTSLVSRLAVALVVVLAGLVGGPGSAAAACAPHLSVATYNVYLGADLLPIASAPTREEEARRAAAVYQQMKRTDFPARARAIAEVIAENPPDVAGLQEVALWSTARSMASWPRRTTSSNCCSRHWPGAG